MKIIATTGYGGTGSSAITNILEEFDDIENIGNFEFRFLQDPDGIKDLEQRVIANPNRFNCDLALKRFEKMIRFLSRSNTWWNGYDKIFQKKFYHISMEYLNSLSVLKWKGFWHYYEINDEYKINKILKIKIFINRIIFKLFQKKLIDINQEMYFLVSEEHFYKKTKEYLDKLFQILNKENKEFLVLDQIVPAINTEGYLKFFSNIKVIVVDRDPRDLFYINKKIWQESWIPTEADIFIKWYKELRNIKKSDHKDILYIKFEDLIYNYDKSLEKILIFLEISNNKHKYKMKKFDPKISIRNTNIFDKKNVDILKIEKELNEYCYNFEKYDRKTERELEKIF